MHLYGYTLLKLSLIHICVTNDDLGQIMETSDEWIRSRTGIIARHIAVEETTTGTVSYTHLDVYKRQVVTGMGAVTPIGLSVDEFWQNVKAQKTGFSEITKFDTTNYKCKLAAEVKEFDAKNYICLLYTSRCV